MQLELLSCKRMYNLIRTRVSSPSLTDLFIDKRTLNEFKFLLKSTVNEQRKKIYCYIF